MSSNILLKIDGKERHLIQTPTSVSYKAKNTQNFKEVYCTYVLSTHADDFGVSHVYSLLVDLAAAEREGKSVVWSIT